MSHLLDISCLTMVKSHGSLHGYKLQEVAQREIKQN